MRLKEKILVKLKNKGISENEIKELLAIKEFSEFKERLFSEKLLTKEEFLKILSEEFQIPLVSLKDLKINEDLKKLLPKDIALKYKIAPVESRENILKIAISDPSDIFVKQDLEILVNKKIEYVLASEEEIKILQKRLYGLEKDTVDILKEVKDLGEPELTEVEELKVDSVIREAERPPIVKIVDLLLYEGLRRRASDIHIEPKEDCLKVRYRIDGILQEAYNIPKKNQNAIIARLKIMSRLDMTETRVPQDGRFKVKFEGREIDFRVSSLPSIFGEKFVLRILDKENLFVGLDKLGFSPEPLEIFKEAIKRPFGMILVTGPTGSGKSTTLYSIIQQLNTPDRNIITIEDPVEYQIEGITQIQVRPEIGLDFAQGLRAILRQSPDIILVGEIRDTETADIAIKAALTGTLILSTLHTNDACGAITRLENMGIEPFLIASSLILVTAQRLCRKICDKCKYSYNVSEVVLKRLGLEHLKDKKFYYGKGCQNCNNTGYKGRTPILECLYIDDAVKELIIKSASSDQIKNFVIKNKGFKTLRDDALKKCLEGVISLEEMVRVTAEEE